MPLPIGITLDDVHEAAARLDAGEPHSFGRPTTYLAVVKGKQYAPKALLGLAARRLAGHDLTPSDFYSGLGSNQTIPVLKELGVEIVSIRDTGSGTSPCAWIFQGNPDRFDIDAYLASTKDITWLVNQHRDSIVEGQTVYLWRSSGRAKGVAGVVAVGITRGPVEVRTDDEAGREFWHDPTDAANSSHRVPIHLVEVASAKQVLKAKWLEDDPICHDLPNLRMRQQTNYPLQSHHAERLARLWLKTGQDFDRVDLLLTLRTYAQVLGGPVSVLPASPVATTALLTGRAVTSIYSKVMNFRSLDPRVEGAGQPNTGTPTKEVWSEFWTGNDIDGESLDASIQSLMTPGDTPSSHQQFETEAAETGQSYSAEGRKRLVTHLKIERNRKVVADAKAKWFVADPMLPCCVCGMSFREVYGQLGEGFIEAHHIAPIASLETPQQPTTEDLVPVCANCHRMLHRRGAPEHETLRVQLYETAAE